MFDRPVDYDLAGSRPRGAGARDWDKLGERGSGVNEVMIL